MKKLYLLMWSVFALLAFANSAGAAPVLNIGTDSYSFEPATASGIYTLAVSVSAEQASEDCSIVDGEDTYYIEAYSPIAATTTKELYKNEECDPFKLAAGDWTLTLDLNNQQCAFDYIAPEVPVGGDVYIFGWMNGSDGVDIQPMTEVSDGLWTIDNVTINDWVLFKYGESLDNWYMANAFHNGNVDVYGNVTCPVDEEVNVVEETGSDNKFAPGVNFIVNITLDLNTMKVTFEKIGEAVSKITSLSLTNGEGYSVAMTESEVAENVWSCSFDVTAENGLYLFLEADEDHGFYGVEDEAGTEVTADTTDEMTQYGWGYWHVAAGMWSVTADFNNNLVSFVYEGPIEEPAPAYPASIYAATTDGININKMDGTDTEGTNGIYHMANIEVSDLTGEGYGVVYLTDGEDYYCPKGEVYGFEMGEPYDLKVVGSALMATYWMLEAGTYNITVDLAEATVEFTQVSTPDAPVLYVLGLNGNWDAPEAIQRAVSAEYMMPMFELALDANTTEFKLATAAYDEAGAFSMDVFNANTLFAELPYEAVVETLLDGTYSYMTELTAGDDANIVMPWAGEWKVMIVDPETMGSDNYMMMIGTATAPAPAYPASIYAATTDGINVTKIEGTDTEGTNGIYHMANIEVSDLTGEGFGVVYLTDGTDYYCPKGEVYGFEMGEPYDLKVVGSALMATYWMLEAGTYNITVDLAEATVEFTQVTTPDAPVLYVLGLNGNWDAPEAIQRAVSAEYMMPMFELSLDANTTEFKLATAAYDEAGEFSMDVFNANTLFAELPYDAVVETLLDGTYSYMTELTAGDDASIFMPWAGEWKVMIVDPETMDSDNYMMMIGTATAPVVYPASIYAATTDGATITKIEGTDTEGNNGVYQLTGVEVVDFSDGYGVVYLTDGTDYYCPKGAVYGFEMGEPNELKVVANANVASYWMLEAGSYDIRVDLVDNTVVFYQTPADEAPIFRIGDESYSFEVTDQEGVYTLDLNVSAVMASEDCSISKGNDNYYIETYAPIAATTTKDLCKNDPWDPFKLAAGDWTLTLDLNIDQCTFTYSAPEAPVGGDVYVFGWMNDSDSVVALPMTETNDGVWNIENVTINDWVLFKYGEDLANWYQLNAFHNGNVDSFGNVTCPVDEEVDVVEESGSDNKFAPGVNYIVNITLDLNTMKVRFDKIGEAVSKVTSLSLIDGMGYSVAMTESDVAENVWSCSFDVTAEDGLYLYLEADENHGFYGVEDEEGTEVAESVIDVMTQYGWGTWHVAAGKWSLTADFNDNVVSFVYEGAVVEPEPTYPACIYAATTDGINVTKIEGTDTEGTNGIYHMANIEVSDLTGEGFGVVYLTDGTDYYCPKGEVYGFEMGVPYDLKVVGSALMATYWMLEAGTYNITVDLAEATVEFTQVSTPDSPVLYVMGLNGNWETPVEIQRAVSAEYMMPMYELTLDGNTQSFKIATAAYDEAGDFSWAVFDENTLWAEFPYNDVLDSYYDGSYSYMTELTAGNTSNIVMPWAGEWKVMIVDPETMGSDNYEIMIGGTTAPAPIELYARGDWNGWAAEDDYKFTTDDNIIFTLNSVTLFVDGVTEVAFKIADANWGADNWGLGQESVVLNAPFALVNGSNANISVANGFTGSLLFDRRNGTLTLTTSDALNSLEAELNDGTQYFTIQGLPVAEPVKGEIYIKRQGTKAMKVVF